MLMKRLLFALLLAAPLAPALIQSGLAQSSATVSVKRPMTFEDLQKMKRLGDTAVSPDGKWLAYSVTTVDLEKNTKTAELWMQSIVPPSGSASEPQKIAVTQPGDSGVQFAADNKKILFLSSRTGAPQIWQADFDTATGLAARPKKLSNLDMGIDNALWSPDGRSVVFTAPVYPDCPAIKPNDGGVGAECTYERDAALADSKVKAQVFTHLLYRHWNHYTGDKRSHLFLLSVENGDVRDLTPNDPHDVPPFSVSGGGGFAISPDSKELAFTENLDEEPALSISAKIFTLDLTNPAAKPVAVSTSAGGNFNPAYSPDGKYLAWRSEERAGYEADKFRLMLYDRSKRSTEFMLPKFDRWISEFAWGPSSTIIYFTSGDKGEESVYALELKNSTDLYKQAIRFQALPKEALVKGGDLTSYDRLSEFGTLFPTSDGQSLIATRMDIHSPQEVVKFDVKGIDGMVCTCDAESPSIFPSMVAVAPVTHLNDALLAELDLPAMESFWFDAADKTKLQGFVIRPPAFDPAKKYPVKFLIHGGPQGAWGDAWSYRWNPELFAANGYVVVMVNPRGSTGYGQKIVDGVNGDWGGKPFSDLMLGLDAAEKQFSFIDSHRECALGASYGGYMANWILGHSDRFKCIVSHDGMFNPESAYGTTEEMWFNEWEFKGKPWDYYGKPDSENPYRKFSPMMSAKNFKTPTLVIHGQLDYRLDVSEGFQLFDTLQRLKVPSKMLYFPDEGHWVLKPQNSQLWYKTVNDWVDQWTK